MGKLMQIKTRKIFFFQIFVVPLQHKSKAQNWEEARIVVPRKSYQ